MNSGSKIKLIVGLGNIGSEYEKTRHNIGFMIIDRILGKLNGEIIESNCCKSRVYQARLKGKNLILQKPSTYMNLSGEAVLSIMNREKISIDEILVIHDELDLDLGRLKLKQGGSSGGHNGIKSIIELLNNNQNFLRLRIGISRSRNIVDYVLSNFNDNELDLVEQIIDEAANAAIGTITMGTNNAMNKFNSTNFNQTEAL